MGETAGLLAHDDLLYAFKAVLKHALRYGELPPTCLAFDLAVVQAVGDVARAASDSSPIRVPVTEACMAFAKYAAGQDAAFGLDPGSDGGESKFAGGSGTRPPPARHAYRVEGIS